MSSSNVNEAEGHSGERTNANNAGRGSSGQGQRKHKDYHSGEGTPQEAPGPYTLSGGNLPASAGMSQANCEAEPGGVQTSQSTAGGNNFHLSNKSDNNPNS